MPNINITEKENIVAGTFDVSENVVLIPLLYKAAIGEEVPKAIKCSKVSELKAAFAEKRHEADNSYVMAYELLLQGLQVVIKPIAATVDSEGSLTEEAAFKILEDAIVNKEAFKEFESKNLFNIKFITSGAFPNAGSPYGKATALYTTLTALAQTRGDAIALVELKKSYADKKEIIKEAASFNNSEMYQYAVCNFPWATFTASVKNSVGEYTYVLPACFGYLMAYAESVKSNANWFAAAGVIRGEIPNLVKNGVMFEVDEALMHVLQGDNSITFDGKTYTVKNRINVIYNAGTFGHILWGNKVFWSKALAKDLYKEYLNVRILLCDIKKQIYHAAMRTTFEPNDDITWLNFKSLSNTLLDKMKSGRGIKWYKWTRESVEAKATIKAQLTVQPIEAVESFDINIYLTDEDASVTE